MISDFIISIKKIIYITWIKNLFKQTNIKKDYKKQILDYNIKKFSLIIKSNFNMFFHTKILI